MHQVGVALTSKIRVAGYNNNNKEEATRYGDEREDRNKQNTTKACELNRPRATCSWFAE